MAIGWQCLLKSAIMRCSSCQHTNSRVLESRSAESGQSIRRRRECLSCQHRFTTYERIEFVPITVIKRDGKRESFDRSKLVRGLIRPAKKPVCLPAISKPWQKKSRRNSKVDRSEKSPVRKLGNWCCCTCGPSAKSLMSVSLPYTANFEVSETL